MEQTKQATILVVDDDEFYLKLLKKLLAAEGHAVRTVASGEDALASVAEQLPDLIMLDVMMPGIDGLEVTRRLKADSRSRHVPIIMVTVLEDHESRFNGLEAGVEEFLSKPVDHAELLSRVRNMLKVKEYQDFLADHSRILEEQVEARTAELRIAAIAFETQESIMITDQDSRILRVNSAFTQLTGYSAGEAIGRTPAMLKSGRENAEFYRNLWETLIRNKYWQGEIWDRHKNGELYPKWLTITAVTDTNGQVTNYVGTFFDITLHKQAEEMRQLALYDSLTGLPNRRLLLDRLRQAVVASNRSGHYSALMFLDLDNFKPLNDTHGHDVGDLLLVEVARRITGCVREEDTVARFGGDEFVVMLDKLHADKAGAMLHANAVAEKIRATLAKPYLMQRLKSCDGNDIIEHHCTASIGLALFNHEASPEEILKWADMSMYQAKIDGRNLIRFFDHGMAET